MSDVLLSAKGVNGQLELLENKVRIKRKGLLALATQGLKGDKEIFINQISSIQFKKAGALTNGYIQFAFIGGTEAKGALFQATQDENSIMFTKKHQSDFEKIKDNIEQKLFSNNNGDVQTTKNDDIPSQIKKLSDLKDAGILTEEEFQTKKSDLLAKM